MVVFVKFLDNRCIALDFGDRRECTGQELVKEILRNEGLPAELEEHVFLCHNGRVLPPSSGLALGDQKLYGRDSVVTCHGRLFGGKGGFGSMLRAIGAQIEKTTNREACRDLSGRRMRDVNDEKKIAEWLGKKSERDEEKARLKRERLEKLKSSPKHIFEDSNKYTSQLQENLESVDDALQQGLQSSSSTSLGKRKSVEKSRKKQAKKQKLWLGVDEDLSSDDSDEESDAGSSCSSMATSIDMGSEASTSRPSSISSACTSVSETIVEQTTEHTDEAVVPPQEQSATKILIEENNSGTTTTRSLADTHMTNTSAVNHINADDDRKTEIITIKSENVVEEEILDRKPIIPSIKTETDNVDQNSSIPMEIKLLLKVENGTLDQKSNLSIKIESLEVEDGTPEQKSISPPIKTETDNVNQDSSIPMKTELLLKVENGTLDQKTNPSIKIESLEVEDGTPEQKSISPPIIKIELKSDEDDKIKTTPSDDAENEIKVITKVKQSDSALLEPLNLDQYDSMEQLEALGLDILKLSLIALGLKCGGTLKQRAQRLFSIKGIPKDQIDPALLAKPASKRQRKGK